MNAYFRPGAGGFVMRSKAICKAFIWFAALINSGNAYSQIPLSEKVLIKSLEDPWAVVSAPDKNIWITEQAGRIHIYGSDFKHQYTLSEFPDLVALGQGGLLDVAFHPQFDQNGWVYLAYTVGPRGKWHTRITRFSLKNKALHDPLLIIEGPEGTDGAHFGCRLLFDKEGFLYATFGERHQQEKAQDLGTLHGKIVRLHDNGEIPADNPFGADNPVFSYGHRNPQGLDMQPATGALYVAEHGPSGYDAPGGGDEINRLIAGKNYGWPVIHHNESQQGMVTPLRAYTPAIAPSGIAFYTGEAIPEWKGDLFVANLRGRSLLRLRLGDKGEAVEEEFLLQNKFGRLRDVATAPDGALLVLSDSGLLIQLKANLGP